MFQRWCAKTVMDFLGRLPEGRVDVVLPDGTPSVLGSEDGAPRVELRIHNPRFFVRTALAGDVGFGESFMAGEWSTDDLPGLLTLLVGLNRARHNRQFFGWSRFAQRLHAWRHRLRPNGLRGSKTNIAAHYDLSNEFFAAFLDPTMLYSCALYDHPDQALEQAQRNKIQALLDKAEVIASDHLLEIGTGWGGFAIEAAHSRGCRVTTLTLSHEQAVLARRRVAEAGLSDRIDIQVCDYRDAHGRYDKIVSIEMLEAVGHKYLGTFFRACDNLLKPGGRVALQVITVPDQRYKAYRKGCDWIQKHIFPGGLCPSVSAMSAAMSGHSRLVIDQIDSIGLHYVTTLRDWRDAFLRNLDHIGDLGFNEAFQRKWLYYFAYCQAGFATRQVDDLHLILRRR